MLEYLQPDSYVIHGLDEKDKAFDKAWPERGPEENIAKWWDNGKYCEWRVYLDHVHYDTYVMMDGRVILMSDHYHYGEGPLTVGLPLEALALRLGQAPLTFCLCKDKSEWLLHGQDAHQLQKPGRWEDYFHRHD